LVCFSVWFSFIWFPQEYQVILLTNILETDFNSSLTSSFVSVADRSNQISSFTWLGRVRQHRYNEQFDSLQWSIHKLHCNRAPIQKIRKQKINLLEHVICTGRPRGYWAIHLLTSFLSRKLFTNKKGESSYVEWSRSGDWSPLRSAFKS